MRKIFFIIILFFITYSNSFGVLIPRFEIPFKFLIGFNFKKYNSFYWENGIQANYYNKKLHLTLGANFETTLLGSALNSNALKQYNFSLFIDREFALLPRTALKPRLNLGYFYADYESNVFNKLNNSTFTISPELVIQITPGSIFSKKLQLEFSTGYNIIHGDGTNGLGTLYPLYYRMNILYQITNNYKQ